MILLPLKLKIPIFPKVPRCLPLYLLPRASEASSINFKLYFLHIFTSSLMLFDIPNICVAIKHETVLPVLILTVFFLITLKLFFK